MVAAWKDAHDALMFYAEHGSDMPDELNRNVILATAPDIGRVVSFEAVWSGDTKKADAVMVPACPHRSAHSNMMLWNLWHELETDAERESRIAQVRSDWARLQKFTQGYYVNLNEEDASTTHANYGQN